MAEQIWHGDEGASFNKKGNHAGWELECNVSKQINIDWNGIFIHPVSFL